MVYLLMAVAFLHLCQQEVSSDLRIDNFKRLMVEDRADILWNVDNVSSQLKCTTLCLAESKCATFGFVEANDSCQAFGPGARTAMGKHYDGFTAYYSRRQPDWVYDPCVTKDQCHINGSVCFKGKCMCTLGLSFHKAEQACVRKSGGMYDPCVTKDQCHINGSVCFKGKCMCTPGLSFHKAEQACVRKCNIYGKTMSIYEGLDIHEHNTLRKVMFFGKYKLTKKCIARCTSTTAFECLSIDIKPADYVCILSSYGYLDVRESDREAEQDDWQFGTRDCAFD